MTGLRPQGWHPIDRHVGARMRLRRMELGFTQAALAARFGITFQAVQKYEAGRVRISASRLYEVARALGATPDFFFEGYGGGEDEPAHEPSAPIGHDVAALLSGFARIGDPQLQAALRRLIAALAGNRSSLR